MGIDLWVKWRRARRQRTTLAADAGRVAGERFAAGYAGRNTMPVVSTAHAELYDYDQADALIDEPGHQP